MSAKRVLVVDDEADVRFLIRTYLNWNRYEVTEAASGEEALALAQKRAFDLVLLDIRMPGMDGLEACRRLRTLPGCAQVPIVFVSAWSADDKQAKGRVVGGTGFLPKPFSLEQLRQVVAKYTGEKGEHGGRTHSHH